MHRQSGGYRSAIARVQAQVGAWAATLGKNDVSTCPERWHKAGAEKTRGTKYDHSGHTRGDSSLGELLERLAQDFGLHVRVRDVLVVRLELHQTLLQALSHTLQATPTFSS
jgi:hypothetical protein